MPKFVVEYEYSSVEMDDLVVEADNKDEASKKAEAQLEKEFPYIDFYITDVKEVGLENNG